MKFGISDRGFKRLAQDQEHIDLLNYIKSGNLSEWYVHAADKPLMDRNTGYVTLFRNGDAYEEVAHYGEFFNFVKPNTFINITEIDETIMSALKEDYENGYLSPELESFINNAIEFEGEEAWSLMKEELNPSDIIDTAQWWDNAEFTSWFSEKFDYNFIVTYDGAVLLDPQELDGVLQVVTQEELDEIWNI